MTLALSPAAREQRRTLIARVHCARRDLALDEDAYRDVVGRVTCGRTRSAGDCSIGDLTDLLSEFQRLGWNGSAGRRPLSPHAHVRMIYAVWKDLRPYLRAAGSDESLRAYVQRQTVSVTVPEGVSAPEFLTAAQARPVIEGLKAWLKRERAKGARS